jgi:hypothetical protein
VIGTPLRRHASLTLHVSPSALRNSRALAFVQLRFEALRICGFRPPTTTSLPAIPNSPVPLILSSRPAASVPAHPEQPRSGVSKDRPEEPAHPE